MKNIHALERILRALFAVLCLELGFFWLAGGWQIGAYLAGFILLSTAAIQFCPLYRILGLSSARPGAPPLGKASVAAAWLLLIAVLVGGSYASSVFTRKLFIEDFNVMNDDYKQALFLTNKNEREKAIASYQRLQPAYQRFMQKYTAYHPQALSHDAQLNSDLQRVAVMVSGAGDLIRNGDLHQAHLDLEKVRPVFQEIFKRNGFSMLAVALVDFHDAMELLLDATSARDAAKLVALYPQVSEKLKAVEEQANDSEIQAIRKNLDDLASLAKDARTDQLGAKGDELKSSFIKVYLKRG